MDNKKNTNKFIGILVGVVAFVGTSYLVQNLLFKQPKIDEFLLQVANGVNKTCPKMMDADTRLDNVTTLPNNKFQYNYTLVNLSKEQVDTIKMHQLIDANIINGVKTSQDFKIFREHKTTIGYYYKDKEGKYIMRLFVTPQMYN